MVLAPLVLAEHVRRQDVPFVVAMAGGLALVFAGQQQPIATRTESIRGQSRRRRQRAHMGLHHRRSAVDGQP